MASSNPPMWVSIASPLTSQTCGQAHNTSWFMELGFSGVSRRAPMSFHGGFDAADGHLHFHVFFRDECGCATAGGDRRSRQSLDSATISELRDIVKVLRRDVDDRDALLGAIRGEALRASSDGVAEGSIHWSEGLRRIIGMVPQR